MVKKKKKKIQNADEEEKEGTVKRDQVFSFFFFVISATPAAISQRAKPVLVKRNVEESIWKERPLMVFLDKNSKDKQRKKKKKPSEELHHIILGITVGTLAFSFSFVINTQK